MGLSSRASQLTPATTLPKAACKDQWQTKGPSLKTKLTNWLRQTAWWTTDSLSLATSHVPQPVAGHGMAATCSKITCLLSGMCCQHHRCGRTFAVANNNAMECICPCLPQPTAPPMVPSMEITNTQTPPKFDGQLRWDLALARVPHKLTNHRPSTLPDGI
jgi:hypothetical protein